MKTMVKRENPLTYEQQALVQSNLHIVDAVIRSRIQTDETVVGLGYDDVWQEGCILLCAAVRSYDPQISKLTTYATKVIYNGLVSHCRKVNRHESHVSTISLTECPDRLEIAQDEAFSKQIVQLELENLISDYARQYSGVTRLGIEALLMKANGIGVTEIARLYQVSPSNVGAWISRAKKQLKNNKQFLKDIA